MILSACRLCGDSSTSRGCISFLVMYYRVLIVVEYAVVTVLDIDFACVQSCHSCDKNFVFDLDEAS